MVYFLINNFSFKCYHSSYVSFICYMKLTLDQKNKIINNRMVGFVLFLLIDYQIVNLFPKTIDQLT